MPCCSLHFAKALAGPSVAAASPEAIAPRRVLVREVGRCKLSEATERYAKAMSLGVLRKRYSRGYLFSVELKRRFRLFGSRRDLGAVKRLLPCRVASAHSLVTPGGHRERRTSTCAAAGATLHAVSRRTTTSAP